MLEGLFAFAPFGLQVFRADGRSVVVNRAFREAFGAEPRADQDVFADEAMTRAGVLPLLRRALKGETVHVPAVWFEARARADEGRPGRFAQELFMLPLVDASGRVTHVAVVMKDVTAEMTARELAEREAEARRAAERARERITRLHLVTTALARAVTPLDVADILLDHGLSTLGADRGALHVETDDGHLELVAARGFTAEHLETIRHVPAGVRSPITMAVREGEPVWIGDASELVASYPDLRELVATLGDTSFAAIPLSAGGRPLGALSFDFTDRRQLDLDDRAFALGLAWQGAQSFERARLYRQAQEAARRAEEASRAKDEFLSVLSHELRTPLNAIQGWAHIIATSRSQDASLVARGVEVIQRNVRAQVTLVEDMLDMARIIRGKLRLSMGSVDLAAVVDTAVESVRPSAVAKGVTVEVNVPGGVGIVADADRLQQVLWNLLANAIKFTPRGGRVSVTATAREDAVTLAVRDTGQGIPAHDLPYVFDRFRQVDSSTTRAKGGLGLGLAIVRHVVEAHGGQVRAESAGPGLGTTFELELPIGPAPRAPAVSEPPPRAPSSRPEPLSGDSPGQLEGVRVLVVDDEPDAVELLAIVLEAEGASVRTASSARAALDRIAEEAPDVFVTDIGMPEEDGFGFLRKLRDRGGPLRTVPAIALTAYARREDVEAARAAGFGWHVATPVEPKTSVRVVVDAARSRPPA